MVLPPLPLRPGGIYRNAGGANGVSRRSVLGAGALGAMSLALGACGNDGGGSSSGSQPSSGPLTSPSTKPEKLVVRTWGDPWQQAYTDGPAAAFTRRTGIPVQFDTTDFNEIQAKIKAAVNAGQRPPVDVVVTIESSAFIAGVQNLSEPLDTDVVTRFDQLNEFGRPSEGSAYVNVTSYSQPMVYAADRVSIAPGASIAELWKPAYRGRVFVPSTSPEALLAPVAKSLGINDLSADLTPVWERLAELSPNIGASGDEEEFLSGVQRRQIDLGVTLAATAREAEGLKWQVPSEGASLSFEALYVPVGLPSDARYYANLFINEALSPESGTLFAEALGEVPTHPQAEPAAFMKGDPAFPFTPEEMDKYALRIDPETFARNKDGWSAEYVAAIGR